MGTFLWYDFGIPDRRADVCSPLAFYMPVVASQGSSVELKYTFWA